MSKSYKNELVQLDESVLDALAGALAESKVAAPYFQADSLLAQAEAYRQEADGLFKNAKDWSVKALELRNDIPKYQDRHAKIVDRMRRTENDALNALFQRQILKVQSGEAKAGLMNEARKYLRGELRKTEKYMGWVEEGEQITLKLSELPGEIEEYEKRAKSAAEQGEVLKAKAEELDAEARALLEALNA